jgi:hypothetical protein
VTVTNWTPEQFRDETVQEDFLQEEASVLKVPRSQLSLHSVYTIDSVTGELGVKVLGQATYLRVVTQLQVATAAQADAALAALQGKTLAGGFSFLPATTEYFAIPPPAPLRPPAPRVAPLAPVELAPSVPSSPPAPTSDDDNGWRIGVGVGVGVGGCLLLLIIAAIVVWCMQRPKAPQAIDYGKVAVVAPDQTMYPPQYLQGGGYAVPPPSPHPMYAAGY